ncbi:MAG: Gldg family protein [Gallintestinimicrobium sp.]
MIVESAQRFKVINYNNIYNMTMTTATIPALSVADGRTLTSAIAYVTSDSTSVVYELNGHGETSLDIRLRWREKENVDLADLTLLTEDSVRTINGVLILSPTNDLNAEDADKLIAYLNNGGKVLISTSYIDCFSEEMPNLTKVLSEFGLSIGNGLIVEQDNARMYQNPIYLLPNVSSDSLTNGVYGKSYDYIMMPYAADSDEGEGWSY